MKTMQCPVVECGEKFDVEDDEVLVAVMLGNYKGDTSEPLTGKHEHQIEES